MLLVFVQPLAAVESGTASGTIAVGRQVTAPPARYERDILLGRRRCTAIAVPVKGSRAEVKVYTDVAVEAQRVQACYTPGLLPYIALVCPSIISVRRVVI